MLRGWMCWHARVWFADCNDTMRATIRGSSVQMLGMCRKNVVLHIRVQKKETLTGGDRTIHSDDLPR